MSSTDLPRKVKDQYANAAILLGGKGVVISSRVGVTEAFMLLKFNGTPVTEAIVCLATVANAVDEAVRAVAESAGLDHEKVKKSVAEAAAQLKLDIIEASGAWGSHSP